MTVPAAAHSSSRVSDAWAEALPPAPEARLKPANSGKVPPRHPLKGVSSNISNPAEAGYVGRRNCHAPLALRLFGKTLALKDKII